MDYEFTLDEYDRPIAEFSMGFEAIGKWFSQEIGSDEQRLNDLLDIVNQLSLRRVHERQLFGIELQLSINQQNVEIMPLDMDNNQQLSDIEQTQAEQGTQLYNDESYSACGLPDFEQALVAWQEFIEQ